MHTLYTRIVRKICLSRDLFIDRHLSDILLNNFSNIQYRTHSRCELFSYSPFIDRMMRLYIGSLYTYRNIKIARGCSLFFCAWHTSRRKMMTSLIIIAIKMTLYYDTGDNERDADGNNTIMTKSEFDSEHDDGTILLIIDKRRQQYVKWQRDISFL